MARHVKPGLDYFPFDVNFWDDRRIRLLTRKHGIKAHVVVIRLYSTIYQLYGYYCPWGPDDAELLAHSLGPDISTTEVQQIISEMLERGLLDKAMLQQHGILTSLGIQRRFDFICKQLRRKATISQVYSLLPALDDNDAPEEKPVEEEVTETTVQRPAFTPVQPSVHPSLLPFPKNKCSINTEESTQRKGKEIKGKETKQNESEGKESEWRAHTVQNNNWLIQTAGLCGLAPPAVKAFAERFIQRKVLSGEVHKYDNTTLNRFLIDDLIKQQKNQTYEHYLPATRRISHGKIAVDLRL